MLGSIQAFIRWFVRSIIKLKDWVRDPMNGNDPVTPFNRRYLSTGAGFLLIISFHVGKGFYNILTTILLDAFAYVFNTLVGIVSDLYHARPSYSRWAVKGLVSGVVSAAQVTVLVVKTVASVVAILVTVLLGFFR